MNLQEYSAIVNSSAEEFAATGLDINQLFMWQIYKMNSMYDLPINSQPSLDNLGESPLQRMQGFMKTLQKEMAEGAEILALLKFREYYVDADLSHPGFLTENLVLQGLDEKNAKDVAEKVVSLTNDMDEDLDGYEALSRAILVMIADWLNDMTVYNRSEALKYGIPSESVLACIMGSNFTKLGADGLPIKDENGKVQKGPNFQAPEAAICATMFNDGSLIAEACDVIEVASLIEAVTLPILKDPMLDVLMAAEALEDELDMDLDEEAAHYIDEEEEEEE